MALVPTDAPAALVTALGGASPDFVVRAGRRVSRRMTRRAMLLGGGSTALLAAIGIFLATRPATDRTTLVVIALSVLADIAIVVFIHRYGKSLGAWYAATPAGLVQATEEGAAVLP